MGVIGNLKKTSDSLTALHYFITSWQFIGVVASRNSSMNAVNAVVTNTTKAKDRHQWVYLNDGDMKI